MNTDERGSVATQFGVSITQIERDHFISHLLAFLSREFGNRIQFIGGTALARTHLPTGRLSEDIDLIATQDRKVLAQDLDRELPRALARTHGRLTLEPPLSHTADAIPVLLRTTNGTAVQLQLLSARGRAWPACSLPGRRGSTLCQVIQAPPVRGARRADGWNPAGFRDRAGFQEGCPGYAGNRSDS